MCVCNNGPNRNQMETKDRHGAYTPRNRRKKKITANTKTVVKFYFGFLSAEIWPVDVECRERVEEGENNKNK